MAIAIQALTKRLQGADSPLTENEKLVLRLNEQSPADDGILSAVFLNLVALKPNQVSQTTHENIQITLRAGKDFLMPCQTACRVNDNAVVDNVGNRSSSGNLTRNEGLRPCHRAGPWPDRAACQASCRPMIAMSPVN